MMVAGPVDHERRLWLSRASTKYALIESWAVYPRSLWVSHFLGIEHATFRRVAFPRDLDLQPSATAFSYVSNSGPCDTKPVIFEAQIAQ